MKTENGKRRVENKGKTNENNLLLNRQLISMCSAHCALWVQWYRITIIEFMI